MPDHAVFLHLLQLYYLHLSLPMVVSVVLEVAEEVVAALGYLEKIYP
tara:strand:- start:405 stop:545 length:141 start_codon:yes stop_codon:yes gene_type:complete